MSRHYLYPSSLGGLFVALFLGGGFVLKTFGLPFIIGVAPYWQTQVDDVTQYIAGFNMYFTSGWQFPLLAFDSLNYPQGTRATFVDAIPLYALLLKLLVPASLAPFNPYGVWVALCFIFQMVGAWWISRELRLNSWLFLVALSVFLLISPALMARIGHISLMSHWIILFALALYIRTRRLPDFPKLGWTGLLVSAFYVNIYLFGMASGVYVAALFSKSFRWNIRLIIDFAFPFIVLMGSLFVTLLPLPSGEITREWGFGYYSMNLLSPVLGGRLFQVQASVGAGQYEGFNYLGLGVILALGWSLRMWRRADQGFFYRHWPLSTLMVGYALYALSNQIYFGGAQVLVVEYPSVLESFTSQFRASGRFFWPVGYCVVIFSMLMLYRSLKRGWWVSAVLILLFLQLADLKSRYSVLKDTLSRQPVQQIDSAAWDQLLGGKVRHLYFYPKFKCGAQPPHDSLLPVMKYAAERQYSLNTGYVARYTPRCDDIYDEIASSALEASAYIFVKKEFDGLDGVVKFFSGSADLECHEVDFAFVCLGRD